jgi:hypothetical protein
MDLQNLLEKPLFQLTTQEFLFIQKKDINSNAPVSDSNYTPKNYVYGIKGIAKIFDCSISTAKRFKSSEWIQPAITQRGRKIITDVDLALKLAGPKTGGRR